VSDVEKCLCYKCEEEEEDCSLKQMIASLERELQAEKARANNMQQALEQVKRLGDELGYNAPERIYGTALAQIISDIASEALAITKE